MENLELQLNDMNCRELSSKEQEEHNGGWWQAALAAAGAGIYLYNNWGDFVAGFNEGYAAAQSA